MAASHDMGSMSAYHDLVQNDRTRHSGIRTSDLIDKSIKKLEEIEALEKAHTLPAVTSNPILRHVRWRFFSAYRKLFVAVILVNAAALILLITNRIRKLRRDDMSYDIAATGAGANFLVAVLVRNEHIINALFRSVILLTSRMPLSCRRRAAKVYCHGGVHSGCATARSFWYLGFVVLLTRQFMGTAALETVLAFTTSLTLAILTLILICAHPRIRFRLHNIFEAVHRFGSWTLVICFWAQTLALIKVIAELQHTSYGFQLVTSHSFWMLIVITAAVFYPWTRLHTRKVIRAEIMSAHAIRLYFDYAKLESCMAIRLTDAPLLETHSFATIPAKQDTQGFSVIVSNAGDWTKGLVEVPPSFIYVKGAPTFGFLRVARLFRSIVVVATGSGIGPCLSLLSQYEHKPVRILWASRNPVETYGKDIIEAVLQSDYSAFLIDTTATGRGNLVTAAYSLYREAEAEAVFVISNQAVTQHIVYELESRGVPAYGPIFDS